MPDWVHARRRQIGDRIRENRRARHYSQMQLGERIGRDHKTISRWENAVTVFTIEDLILLAHALDVPLMRLVDVE
ncbi:MAG TPA: helix-turn-helix transcriptional regulator [Candidatus Dormibacteraeota bacterium]|jgi:transcriptional regulator with XRE-family HTH domain